MPVAEFAALSSGMAHDITPTGSMRVGYIGWIHPDVCGKPGATKLISLWSRRTDFANFMLEASSFETSDVVSDATADRGSVVRGVATRNARTGGPTSLAKEVGVALTGGEVRRNIGHVIKTNAVRHFTQSDPWAMQSSTPRGNDDTVGLTD